MGMSREEAIRLLSGLMFKGKLKEALDMAIKALEQEPTTKNNLGVDCISRADARSLVVKIGTKNILGMSGKTFQDLYKGIDNLPPVTPQEPILDKIRSEIIKYEGDCRLSVDEYPSCKQCTDNVFKTIYGILDKYKGESEYNK